ncbi:MAG TPA: TraB/GumN family protein [Candidatus Thermoplasmatota archaeon]|nr:TraB/GumN family protein [Candidatus Thermoplasmatota archaeon]
MIVDRGDIVLVGTAHVSPESVAEVRREIAARRPAVVCVELDEHRARALSDPKWRETPLLDVIRDGKAFVLLAQAFLASWQRRLGERYGVKPGAEMLAGMQEAEKVGASVELSDRDIGVTLKRAWARMGFREKLRLAWEFLKALTGADADGREVEVEELLKEDVLSSMMEEFSRMAPSISEVVIRERDAYLAGRILEARERAKGRPVLAVVGAGHLKGIQRHLDAPESIPERASLETVPERFPWGKAIGYGLAIGILALFAWLGYGALTDPVKLAKLQEALLMFVLVTGSFSALGAAAALAHPYSILAAFSTAWFATIHPGIATGWISGYVELQKRKPTVADYEGLSTLAGLGDFYRNKITRVLLVTALTNVGAMVGFWLGAAALLPIAFG